MDLELPFIVHDYMLTEEIGRGGFSRVYKATSEKFHTVFVAKVITLNSQKGFDSYDSIFRAETDSLADLNHPNIIRLYDSFVERNLFVMILEYCPNGCLMDEVNSSGGLKLEQFVNYGRQIVCALNYCHSRNIAHHDIKLHNILIDTYGRPKIADFGLSLKMDNDNDLINTFKGSLAYIAPEIINKKAYSPFKADVWALGVAFVFMMTGESPWSGAKGIQDLKSLICLGTYQLSKPIPQQVIDLIKKMLVVDPAKRISMKDLAKCKLFETSSSTFPLFSPRKMSEFDALSPRGRRQSFALCSECSSSQLIPMTPLSQLPQEQKGQSLKSINIYKTNILQGFIKGKKIKSRLCAPMVQTYIM